MSVNFVIRGRLGNAIFRYLACAVLCIKYNKRYSICSTGTYVSEKMFLDITNNTSCLDHTNLNLNEFYQYDSIYRIFKNRIINFIEQNPQHLIITDGILAGDGRYETFKMYDIIHVPSTFTKIYENVLHVRLEDFVINNSFIKVDRVLSLLSTINFSNICIVCKNPETTFECEYIKKIKDYLVTREIHVHMEHNDVLTDYYIMKMAKTLICSMSTLSWCASLLSNVIETCYVPTYNGSSYSFKSPIDNTFYY